MKQGTNTTVAIAVIMFAAVCVGVIGAIVWVGRDPGPLVTFILAVVPLTIGVIYNVRQNGVIQAGVEQVAEQVNGKLDAKFKAIHDRMDAIPGVPTATQLNMTTPDKMGENHEQSKPATP